MEATGGGAEGTGPSALAASLQLPGLCTPLWQGFHKYTTRWRDRGMDWLIDDVVIHQVRHPLRSWREERHMR